MRGLWANLVSAWASEVRPSTVTSVGILFFPRSDGNRLSISARHGREGKEHLILRRQDDIRGRPDNRKESSVSRETATLIVTGQVIA